MTPSNENPRLKILRINQLVEKIGLGKSAIYAKIDPKSPSYDQHFPKPIKLGIAKICPPIGFIEWEVDVWIEIQMGICRRNTHMIKENS